MNIQPQYILVWKIDIVVHILVLKIDMVLPRNDGGDDKLAFYDKL